MFVRPTQTIENFGNVSTPFGTLAIPDLSVKILRRSSQGNPPSKHKRGRRKYSDFGPTERYISETVQCRSLVSINHWEVAYELSIGTKIGDLG